MKVFMLVIMPLITGGALTGLLSRFGIRMPAGIERMFGGHSGYGGTSIGRDRHGEFQFERSRVDGPLGGLGGLGGSVGGAISLAKMFM